MVKYSLLFGGFISGLLSVLLLGVGFIGLLFITPTQSVKLFGVCLLISIILAVIGVTCIKKYKKIT